MFDLHNGSHNGRKEKAMTEIILKDGRIFNSRFSDPEIAIADIADYLFAEYDETLNADDIAIIETF